MQQMRAGDTALHARCIRAACAPPGAASRLASEPGVRPCRGGSGGLVRLLPTPGSPRARWRARHRPRLPYPGAVMSRDPTQWGMRWRASARRRVALGRRVAWLCLLVAVCATHPAWAWEPSAPIELIVPAGVGGGADQVARLLQRSSAAHDLFGQPLVVINKSGGDGAEGFLHMKASAGNPHKLLMALSNLFTTPQASGIPFSYRDLTPVGMLALDDFVLWVHAGSPFASARDFFDAIRAAPSQTFSIGGTGVKQEDQLLALAIEKRLGKKLTYLPFRGGGEVAARLVERRVTCTVNNPREALDGWRSGALQPLCVFRADPMPYSKKLTAGLGWSSIPTCKSAGVDLEYRMLRGVFLPGGVPAEVVAYHAERLRRLRELPEWREFLEEGALEDHFLTGPDLDEWLARADEQHRVWMRDAGLLPEQLRSR